MFIERVFSLVFFAYFLQGFINREFDAGFLMSLACPADPGEVLLEAVVCEGVRARID